MEQTIISTPVIIENDSIDINVNSACQTTYTNITAATIAKISYSINELETAVNTARKIIFTINEMPFEKEIIATLARFDEYEKVIKKQRKLFAQLCTCYSKREIREMNQLIKIIGGLSAMIREDVMSNSRKTKYI